MQDIPQEQSQVLPSALAELQMRVLKAEATQQQKEEENTALREKLQQFETRWSEYEEKMKSMEETWQKQMVSLQVSLHVHTYVQINYKRYKYIIYYWGTAAHVRRVGNSPSLKGLRGSWTQVQVVLGWVYTVDCQKKIILGLTKTEKGLEDSQKYFGKNCNLDGNK